MAGELDFEIANYIEAIQSGKSLYDVLRMDKRWEVFYHLSPLRRSLFNWYPFREDASLLEVGSGFGALTGLFCETCSHVTVLERNKIRAQAVRRRYENMKNLEVYHIDVTDFYTDKMFDYVVLTGGLERQFQGSKNKSLYIGFLKVLQRFLKPNGKLLLSVHNRYGLKYFCGAKNPHTKRAFSGLNQYEECSTGYNWGKDEFTKLLKTAGFGYSKFYYPLPDYRLPQLIFSDDYLPGSNIHERLIPYYENEDPLVVDEKALYQDVIENHVFPFFANSFLTESSTQSVSFSDVYFAALTTDRGEAHGFATTIRSDRIVRKTALYPKGEQSLRQFFEHIEDIRLHGVETVPHSFHGKYVEMPLIYANSLSEDLGKIIEKDPKQLGAIIKLLYQMILKSSDHVGADENRLAKKYKGKKLAEHISEEDYGVILKNAYIDMIPFNCFYQDGKLLFYDQEFVRKGYPAKYTLFRALLYTYYFIPEAEKILPLAELKKMYRLDKVWELFEKEEQEFVADNRNRQLYESFYKWADVNKEQINKRITLLGNLV